MESNLMALIHNRQSVRSYADTPVEREKFEQLIEAARLAPSACNSQPWRFVAVTEKELVEQFRHKVLGGITGGNLWAKDVPAFIVICVDASLICKIGSKIKKTDLHQLDIGIAGEHIALRATELGLGTCWIGWFNKKECRKLLQIPKNVKIPALLTVGYPADTHREKKRKAMEEILCWNEYGF
jgi:nitroreductase